MRIKVLARHAILLLGTALTAAPVLAQRIDTITDPAELPPSSYREPQYVDSRGCVFIRAGFDDAVIWVPRVSRAGEPVCGYTPSLAGQSRSAEAPAAAPAPTPAPAPKSAPVRTTSTATSGAPMTTVASKPAPPQPVAVVKAPASKPPAAPAPRVVASVPAPTPAPAPVVVPAPPGGQLVGGGCAPGFSGEIVSNGRTVRCGAQTTPYVTEVRRGEAPAPGKNVYYNHGGGQGSWQDGKLIVPGGTRILPRHVYEEGPAERTLVPAGYRPAWEDDRLNPHRALQTVKGYYDTQRVWTREVPYASTAGTHVVAQAPRVRFEGDRVLAPAQSSGTVIAAASDSAETPRFIQIGAFSSVEKAEAATRRLRAAGLPVQQLARSSDGMRRLRVGPYDDGRAAELALAKVRATGYREARLR